MSLYTRIQEEYILAFKAKDLIKKDILNYLFSQLKNKRIDLQRDLTDDEVIHMVKKEIKTRQESITFAEQANKQEEVSLEKEKIAILHTYLPKQLTAEALTVLIKKAITTLNITDLQKQRGQLIGYLMKQYGSQIDGQLLNSVISSL